jgi:hypothetical protein
VGIQILNATLHSPAASLLTMQHTMAPSCQSITPDTYPSPATAPTKKDLPIELWLQIFEHIHSEDYARPLSVAEYAASLTLYGDDDIAAANDLHQLERERWQRSRPLYAINQNSRATALKLRLCLRALQTCKEPVSASGFLKEWDALSVPWQRALVRQTPRAEVRPALRCIAIQIYQDPSAAIPETHHHELHSTIGILTRHDSAAKHYFRSDTAKRVVLLFDPCWETDERDRWARVITRRITRFWALEGIVDGKVDVM